MKTLITTLNSKYIHTSLSLRLLYVACKEQHQVDFKEYTINDHLDTIIEDILKQKCQVIAFSVYIWNVDKIEYICKQLKTIDPTIIIVIGGPEVSYEIDYFLDTFAIDYLISGEGEIAFNQLLESLENDQEVSIQGISTLQERDYRQTKQVDLSYIETLASPYLLEQDSKDQSNRILYFETSRGCPYLCQYCLSSLEKGLRFYSEEYLKHQLANILASDVKTVKVLDRSFNAKTSHALMILEYLFTNYRPGIQFQFEINGDVLDQKIIDYIVKNAPVGFLRFEIGIQSTYQPTNEVVKRYQDFERLSSVIQQLQDSHVVDLHLDLIAGLPLETLSRFAKSFDDVFQFHPKELQLGFLKLLRGTSLRQEYQTYGYLFDIHPPYEITCSNDLSKEDITAIHIAEDMLEKYWNSGKMPLTMDEIIKQVDSPFYFFLSFGNYYKEQQCKTIHYQNDELFSYLNQYLLSVSIDLEMVLIEDYLRLSKVKPKRWWKPTMDKVEVKKVLHYLVDTYSLSQEKVFRNTIVERYQDTVLLAIYNNYQVEIQKYKIG